jgi:hypothetical protein
MFDPEEGGAGKSGEEKGGQDFHLGDRREDVPGA